MKKNNLLSCAAISSLTFAMSAAPSFAQVEEIVVTATKRAESTQDIAVAVTALSAETLEENNIDVFSDYLLQLPNVTAASAGPGQGTIFIRGISASAANTTTGVAAGLAPNVALYFDEQPVTQVGRNLDVYAVDLNRVEVLPGPQGTLFGASAQAGVIRLISNKPKLGVEEANLKLGASFTEGGDASAKASATYNLPIGDKFALRGTFFGDFQGGYIDNVAGEFNIGQNQLFGGGFAPLPDISGLEGGVGNNDAFVEDNFNDVDYSGFRIGGYYEFNDDWSLLVQNQTQFIDAQGVFFVDPEIDSDLRSIQRFADDDLEDDFSNTAWTLEGRLGFLDAVYTGAFNSREFQQRVDYTDYNFIGSYIPFYTCNNYSFDAAANTLTGSCNSPLLFADIENETDTQTHELRFTTPAEERVRATFGGFYSDQENVERVDFTYPGSIPLSFPNAPISVSEASDLSVRDPGVVFINDITRTDEQLGLFAEVSYDIIPDTLSVTGGIRYFDVRVDFTGSSNFTTTIGSGNLGDTDTGFNLTDIFDGDGTFTAFPFNGDGSGVLTTLPFDPIDEAVSDGVIFKGNITWTPNDEQLYYATFSQGFRPGVLNRPAVANDLIQPSVGTDDLDNFEIGWKTRFLNNTLQFNGSAFWVLIDDLQTSVFDPVNLGTNLFVGSNAADARVRGIEADFIWAPETIEGLTINGAISILDTEVTEVLQPSAGGEPSIAIAPEGSDLAFAPNFQGNLRARYEWQAGASGFSPYAQIQGSVSTSSFSDLTIANRAEQNGYFLGGGAFGAQKDGFGVEVFVENFTDERVEIANNFVFQRERVSINRPRTWGMRLSYDFE